MWWWFPIIVIGGIFWHLIGYLVLGMILFFLSLAAFKGRYWCGWFCPRGAFLERVIVHISRNKKIPAFFKDMRFRWAVFVFLMCFMIGRLIQSGGEVGKIGFVFVMMCMITGTVAISLGIIFKPRTWCSFCPMGTLQGVIGRNKFLLSISKDCIGCKKCEKVCPIETSPSLFKASGKIKSVDCLRCPECIANCPKKCLKFSNDK